VLERAAPMRAIKKTATTATADTASTTDNATPRRVWKSPYSARSRRSGNAQPSQHKAPGQSASSTKSRVGFERPENPTTMDASTATPRIAPQVTSAAVSLVVGLATMSATARKRTVSSRSASARHLAVGGRDEARHGAVDCDAGTIREGQREVVAAIEQRRPVRR
jgi:hypothetical protein